MQPVKLKAREPAARGALRVFQGQVERARSLLQGRKPIDQKVHAARKELKKARATLRLLRGAIGEAAYRRENAALRDVARPLSVVRDAKVLLDTLDSVLEGDASGARRAQVLRKRLHDRCTRCHRAPLSSQLRRASRALRQVRERSLKLSVDGCDWSAIGEGLRRTYRRGQRGLAEVGETRNDDALHEWRKQVNYLWRQLEVLEPIRPGDIGKLADRIHKLGSTLGDDHDLAVLALEISKHKDAFPEAARLAALLDRIDRRRNRFQKRALTLARKIYDASPKQTERRFRGWWRERAVR